MYEDETEEETGGALPSLYSRYAQEEEALRKQEEARIQSRWQRGMEALQQQRMGPSKTQRIAEALLAFGQPTRGGGWAALGNAGRVVAERNAAIKQSEADRAAKLRELEDTRDASLGELAQKYGAGRLAVLGKLATTKTPEYRTIMNPVTGQQEWASGPNVGQPVNPTVAAAAADRPLNIVTIDGVKYLKSPKGDLEPLKAAPKSDEEIIDAAAARAEAIAEGKARGEAKAKATSALKAADELVPYWTGAIDQLIGQYDPKTGKQIGAPHAGFSAIIGMPNPLKGSFGGAEGKERIIPGSPAAGALALKKQIQGATFLKAFDTLKGGGAISEKEGTAATAALARLSSAQSEEDFTKAALELRNLLTTGYARLKQSAASPSATSSQGRPRVKVGASRPAQKKLPPIDLSKYKTGG